MAKPAFIYAFDNLGPDRFAELCGLLLASRYKGFLLGGVGADGGIDAEIDQLFGMWRPESASPLLNEVIQPKRLVVFQFKHKVTARVGQAQTRTQLLNLYKCKPREKCELHGKLITKKRPNAYVLVTNVEVNSEFRTRFIEQCKSENSKITHYQIIGLDELEAWVTSEPELRHIYFPTIFGEPRFNLQIQMSYGFTTLSHIGHGPDLRNVTDVFQISILNMGTVPSYIGSINFKVLVEGEPRYLLVFDINDPIMMYNPKPGTAIEPGRKHTYNFPFHVLQELTSGGKKMFPVEVFVQDEIGNVYTALIPDDIREMILSQ